MKLLQEGAILLSGFPCQPFSVLQEGDAATHADAEVIKLLLKIVGIAEPEAFLLENIMNLAIEHRETFDAILLQLQEGGYHVGLNISTASDTSMQTRGTRPHRPHRSMPSA